jgi:phosphoserine phosphatase
MATHPDSTVTPAPEAIEEILEFTRKLATHFDPEPMLADIVAVAKRVLRAERGSVLLYDRESDELVFKLSADVAAVRFPADRGIAGACIRTRQLVNVPDCYADQRFNPEVDRASGFRTRCVLALPLVGLDNTPIGVLQVLNKHDGTFDTADERIASLLAAQCAVALHRAQMLETRKQTEKLDREIAVARELQMSTLPKSMPEVPGYDGAGLFRPMDQTGGDLFDFVRLADGRLFLLLGDATGHGIGPALSATQVQGMIRVALRLGASLDETYKHVNDQLAEDLPPDRFVTAFLGLLNPATHEVEFHAGGQGPLLHYRAAEDRVEWHGPTTFPMGAMPQPTLLPAHRLHLGPGDVLGLISDGIYEYVNRDGAMFGESRVGEAVRAGRTLPMQTLVSRLLDAVQEFGAGAEQADDVTVVLIRRNGD